MTTPQDPLDGMMMPYSATLYPVAGTNTMHIIPEHRNWHHDYRLLVPPGVSTVMASINTGHEIAVWSRQGNGALNRVLTINSRDTPLGSASAVGQVSAADDQVSIYALVYPTPTQADVDSGLLVGLTVIPVGTHQT